MSRKRNRRAKNQRPDRKGTGVLTTPETDRDFVFSDGDRGDYRIFIPGQSQPDKHKLSGYDAFLGMFKRHFAVSSCVGLIAEAMMAHGWEIVPAKKNSSPSDAQLAPFAEFVNNCHPFFTFEEFLTSQFHNLALAWKAYVEVVPNELGQPVEMFDLPQGTIRPIVNSRGTVDPARAFVQKIKVSNSSGAKSEEIYFEQRRIMWWRFPGPNGGGVNPMSPIECLELPLKSSIASEQYIYSFFESGGKMGLILENEAWTEDMALEARRYYEREYGSGASKGHKLVILYDGTTIKEPPKAYGEWLQFINVQQFDGRKICARFGIDPRLIGYPGEGNLGGKGEREQLLNEFHINNINPKKAHISKLITKHLLVEGFGITDWVFQLKPFRTNVDETSRQALATTYMSLAQGGFINREKASDVNIVRNDINPEFEEVTDDELLTWPKPAHPNDPNPMTKPADETGEAKPSPDTSAAPAPDTAPALDFIQDTALNGAQVNALQEIVQAVADGTLPGEAAVEMILIAFPTVDEATARKIVKAAAKMAADRPDPVAVPAPEPKPAPEQRRAPKGAAEKRTPWADIETRMTSWSSGTEKSIIVPLRGIIAKTADKMGDWYAGGEITAVTKANLLPGAGQLMVAFRTSLKDYTRTAQEAAAEEILRAAKDAGIERRGTWDSIKEATMGTIDDFIELAGQTAFDSLFGRITSTMRGLFQAALRGGWSKAETVSKIAEEATGVAEADLSTIVRTHATDFFNIARERAAKESTIVEGYQYSAILDDRTTEVCNVLDGLQLKLSDPDVDRVRPPNHYNCRSVLTFVLLGEGVTTDQRKLEQGLRLIASKFGGKRSAEATRREEACVG